MSTNANRPRTCTAATCVRCGKLYAVGTAWRMMWCHPCDTALTQAMLGDDPAARLSAEGFIEANQEKRVVLPAHELADDGEADGDEPEGDIRPTAPDPLPIPDDHLLQLYRELDRPCSACNGAGEVADKPCLECYGWGVEFPVEVRNAVPSLIGEVRELRSEVARLRAIVNGMAERIAAQSDALSWAAEKDALARLEAWRTAHPSPSAHVSIGTYHACAAKWGWWIRLADGPWTVHVEGHRREHEHDGSELRTIDGVQVRTRPWRFWAGTDDRPATLAECIDAALAKWQELYGKETPQ